MKQRKTIGIISIVIGIVMLSYSGFNYVTTEKVVDIGPIQINKENNHSIQWPPFIGVLLLFGGIAIVVSSKK